MGICRCHYDPLAHETEMLTRKIMPVYLLFLTLVATCASGLAQGRFEIITGKLFQGAVPRDFYLEGNAIPVEKRNAVLFRTPEGARTLFGLIATAGFASRLQQKYSGMLISEGTLSICGRGVGVGSYGFGIRRRYSLEQPTQFLLYNQAGDQIMECDMESDAHLREPRPLQIVIESSRSARLYLGREWLRLGP